MLTTARRSHERRHISGFEVARHTVQELQRYLGTAHATSLGLHVNSVAEVLQGDAWTVYSQLHA